MSAAGDRCQCRVRFLISFRSRGHKRASRAAAAINTNVVHKAAKWAPGTGTVSVYYVRTTGQVERKNKFGPRALVITRGQTVPGDMLASRGHTAGLPLDTRTEL